VGRYCLDAPQVSAARWRAMGVLPLIRKLAAALGGHGLAYRTDEARSREVAAGSGIAAVDMIRAGEPPGLREGGRCADGRFSRGC